MWDRIKEHALAVVYSTVIFIAIFYIVILVNSFDRKPTSVSVVATPASVVAHEAKIDVVPTAPVKVFKRSAIIKKKVMLPQAVIDNPKEQVLAASRVESNLRPQTVTTLLNTETGETSTYIKQEPIPWLSTNTHGEFSTYMGVKNSVPTLRIQAKQNLFDVKSVHINAVGSVDQSTNGNTDFFVGVGATYAW